MRREWASTRAPMVYSLLVTRVTYASVTIGAAAAMCAKEREKKRERQKMKKAGRKEREQRRGESLGPANSEVHCKSEKWESVTAAQSTQIHSGRSKQRRKKSGGKEKEERKKKGSKKCGVKFFSLLSFSPLARRGLLSGVNLDRYLTDARRARERLKLFFYFFLSLCFSSSFSSVQVSPLYEKEEREKRRERERKKNTRR